MTSCQISLKPTNGPVRAHRTTTATAAKNVVGLPAMRDVRCAKAPNESCFGTAGTRFGAPPSDWRGDLRDGMGFPSGIVNATAAATFPAVPTPPIALQFFHAKSRHWHGRRLPSGRNSRIFPSKMQTARPTPSPRRRRRRFHRTIVLLLIALFFLPIGARGAAYYFDDAPRSWSRANWDSIGSLPPAAEHP